MQDSFLEFDSSESWHNVNNYWYDNYDPNPEQIDKFRDVRMVWKIRILFTMQFSMLFTFSLKNKKDECQSVDQLKQDLGNDNLYDTLSNLKQNLRLNLDIQNFENQCHSVNKLLNKNGLILRVYELKDKFCYLIKQNSKWRPFWENYLDVSSKSSMDSI